jgi:hypothetical protein
VVVTTQYDNLFLEEVAKIATKKHQALKEKKPSADDKLIAIVLALECLSVQLIREIELDEKEQELEELRHKLVTCKQEQSKIEDSL